MHIKFTKNGVSREVKAGFSWTVFFFGPFAFAWRGMWGMFFICWIAAVLTLGLSALVFPFFANRWYARWLAERGWCTLDRVPSSWGFSHPTR